MSSTPRPWPSINKEDDVFVIRLKPSNQQCVGHKIAAFRYWADAEFARTACNTHDEAMELLERISIELHRPLTSGGMETNVAESLGLDELLVEIEQILIKGKVDL